MAGTFDLWQQAFTLVSMSSAAAGQHGSPDALARTLNAAVDAFLTQPATTRCLGEWHIGWGPAIFEKQPGRGRYADNTIYVAANADHSVYVVATAGTNWNSGYDLHQEDLDIRKTVAWVDAFPSLQPYGVPAATADPRAAPPHLSAGTANGVNALIELVDPLQGTGQTLPAFLQAVARGAASESGSTRPTLILGGHSLAGALSPALALALFNPAGGPLTASDWHAVYVYPTAGTTPGNAAFASCFSSVFPAVAAAAPGARPYQVWNVNVWNTLDAVPHLWKLDAIGEIPRLYPASWTQAPIALGLDIEHFKYLSETGARSGAGPYEPIAGRPQPGAFNETIPVTDLDSFRAQAYFQHTTAYDILLHVQDLMPATMNQTGFTPTVRTIVSGSRRTPSR